MNPCRWLAVASILLCGAVAATCRGADGGAPAPAPAGGGPTQETSAMRFYVGTYTGPSSKGIYLFELDARTGALKNDGLAAETPNPSFLAFAPGASRLYSVNEGGGVGVSGFDVDRATGKLTPVNHQPSVGGGGPCHLTVDPSGKNVLVANYGGGSLAVYPLEPDGRLKPASCVIQHHGTGPNKARQDRPHAHSVYFDPAGKHVLACDLGTDEVDLYHFDAATGTLTPNDPPAGKVPPGSGPRHLAFGLDGRFVYVVNEVGNSVTVFAYDPARGSLSEIQTISTLPAGYAGPDTAAEIAVHPSGKFLYASNRGRDSIAIFTIDARTGKLASAGEQLTLGKGPRHFALDPSGAFLIAANQNSENLVTFRVGPTSGALTPAGDPVPAPKPVCVLFAPQP